MTRLSGLLRPRAPAPWLVPTVLCAVGAALRLWQYAAGASLWADEANLALNVIDRPLWQLLGPLDYRQIAPPGWLLLVKGAVTLLGDGEHALRLIPLLGSLAALPLTWHVARRALPFAVAPPLALGLVATGLPLIFYAAQVKPYATDVAVALGLLVLALSVCLDGVSPGRVWALGVAGAVAPWVSYPAVLVGAGLLIALGAATLRRRDRASLRPLGLVALAWIASGTAVLAWAHGTVTAEDALYFQRFWIHDFMPLPPRELWDLGWPIARLTTMYGGGGLRYPAPGFFLALGALGAWGLWRTARDRAALLLWPILATLGAAVIHVFPFEPRVVLFLFPIFLMLTAAGPDGVVVLAGRSTQRVAALAAVACAVFALVGLARSPLPYLPEPLGPVLREMREAWQPGDRVYVYYGGEKAFVYYARRYGFAPGDYVLGRCAREDPRAYLREVDAFRGAPRLWLVVTHGRPAEVATLRGYLDRIGTRRTTIEPGADDAERRRDRAWADLYDLSDPARLAAVTAETSPLPPSAEGGVGAGWSCHPGALSTEDDEQSLSGSSETDTAWAAPSG